MRERRINDEYDVVVVGAGLAGLTTAIGLAESYRVALITKEDLLESNSRYAQGGIAAVVGDQDSVESHIQDTIISGAGLCDPKVVEQCVRLGPHAIDRLVRMGVQFDRRGDGRFQLGKEGGHSHRRILHSGDSTGYAIIDPLVRAARAHENIKLFTFHTVIELLRADGRICGVRCLDESEHCLDLYGRHTILATGGCGQVFHRTTNPGVATGDGLAMALRAGVAVKDLEFYQFHPTCLALDGAPRFLVSEALRGEGGRLINGAGVAFMKGYDERADLAPRDIVARAIHREMEVHRSQVFLDMTHRTRDELRHRFPSIFQVCQDAGLDISVDPIPVSPAAHYACGGIQVDEWGNTNVEGLSAVGEVACTGL
ncbi:MAG: L-aspartate oxidase, partial [Bradymonadia bacterium]